MFSKIDVTESYNKMGISHDHQKYHTINTHRSLFQCKRLPYRMTNASVKFKHTTEQVCSDLGNVQVFLDDLITGKNDEHLNV